MLLPSISLNQLQVELYVSRCSHTLPVECQWNHSSASRLKSKDSCIGFLKQILWKSFDKYFHHYLTLSHWSSQRKQPAFEVIQMIYYLATLYWFACCEIDHISQMYHLQLLIWYFDFIRSARPRLHFILDWELHMEAKMFLCQPLCAIRLESVKKLADSLHSRTWAAKFIFISICYR